MWPPWIRSPRMVRTTSAPTRTIRNFSCSSFKDLQTLLNDEPESPPSIFHRVRISDTCPKPGTEHVIIVYFTSLRVVRRTFEDCRTVRSILRGFRVSVDERDVSMDVAFLNELQRIQGRKRVTLPCVFIGGRLVGGVDEIRRLHESDELKRLIGRFPVVRNIVCDACDGHRFVVCEVCDGSRKVYEEKTGFRCCTNCNVNGLIKCRACSSTRLRYRES